MNHVIRCIVVVFASLMPCIAPAQDVNVITVDTTSDAAQLPDACTLVAALDAAGSNQARGACPAGRRDRTDVVVLPDGGVFTYAAGVSTGNTVVQVQGPTGDLVVEGRGATIRRAPTLPACREDGGLTENTLGFMFVIANQRPNYTFRDLTIRGFCGSTDFFAGGIGAITLTNVGSATFERVRLLDNIGLGALQVFASGNVRIADSVLGNNLNLENHASAARIILDGQVPQSVDIERTTFDGNRYFQNTASPSVSGALVVLGLTTGEIRLRNNTFVKNLSRSVAALTVNAPTVALHNNTFSGNRALQPVAQSSTFQIGAGTALLGGNLLAGLPSGNCRFFVSGATQFAAGNISTDPTCAGFTLVSTLDLRPLGDFGGPVPSMPPLASSPAIDAAAACGTAASPLLVDTRGVARPQDGNGDGLATCDSGAVEFVRNRPPVVSGPASQTAFAGTPLVFSAANSSLIGVVDTDARALPLRATISADVGRVRFGSELGLSCSAGTGGASGDALRRCEGTLAAINAALVGMQYLPAATAGAAELRVEVNDLGNGGDDNNPLGDTLGIAVTTLVNAPVLSLSTSSVDFGPIAVGVAAPSRALTLGNSGNQPLVLASISQIGGSPDFGFSSNCPLSPPGNALAPGATCAINVWFTAAAVGERTGALAIASNAAGSPALLLLNGIGTSELVFSSGFE